MIAPEGALMARVEKLCERALADAAHWEAERRYPVDSIRIAGEEGLAGMKVSVEQGGLGLSAAETAGVMECLANHDMAFAFALNSHASFTADLARSGTGEQRERYLPDMLAGRMIGSFLLTEPGAGSDAASITTQARRHGGGWRIDGEKAWVTNGTGANLLKVFAQTDPARGWRGIAAFLVETDTPGVERLPPYAVMGGHATGVCGMRFSQVDVGDGAMLHAPGKAFKGALSGIDSARLGVAAMCCGMMASALGHALVRTTSRELFGQVLGDFQAVQWMLADASTDLEAARLLTGRAAELIDGGADASVACAHAKKFATRAAWKAISDCMQTMGAHGFRIDAGHPLPRHLAAARMAQWLDGATEIQNLVIARDLLKRAKDGVVFQKIPEKQD